MNLSFIYISIMKNNFTNYDFYNELIKKFKLIYPYRIIDFAKISFIFL